MRGVAPLPSAVRKLPRCLRSRSSPLSPSPLALAALRWLDVGQLCRGRTPRPPPDCSARRQLLPRRGRPRPPRTPARGGLAVCWLPAWRSPPPRQRHHHGTPQWGVEGDKGQQRQGGGWCCGQWPLRAGDGTPPARAAPAGAGGTGAGRPCAPYPALARVTLAGRRQPGPSAPRLPRARIPGDGRFFRRSSLHSWEAATSHLA